MTSATQSTTTGSIRSTPASCRAPWLRNDVGILAIWHLGAGSIELVGLRLDYAHPGLAYSDDADWIADRLRQACGRLGTA